MGRLNQSMNRFMDFISPQRRRGYQRINAPAPRRVVPNPDGREPASMARLAQAIRSGAVSRARGSRLQSGAISRINSPARERLPMDPDAVLSSAAQQLITLQNRWTRAATRIQRAVRNRQGRVAEARRMNAFGQEALGADPRVLIRGLINAENAARSIQRAFRSPERRAALRMSRERMERNRRDLREAFEELENNERMERNRRGVREAFEELENEENRMQALLQQAVREGGVDMLDRRSQWALRDYFGMVVDDQVARQVNAMRRDAEVLAGDDGLAVPIGGIPPAVPIAPGIPAPPPLPPAGWAPLPPYRRPPGVVPHIPRFQDPQFTGGQSLFVRMNTPSFEPMASGFVPGTSTAPSANRNLGSFRFVYKGNKAIAKRISIPKNQLLRVLRSKTL